MATSTVIVICVKAYIMKEYTSFAKGICLSLSLYTIATTWHAATIGPAQYSSDNYKSYVHKRCIVIDV